MSVVKLKLFILKMARPILKFLYRTNFDISKYAEHFISKYPKKEVKVETKANEVIYGFWTGTNEITPNRKRCIETIEKFAGVPFILVTPDNLEKYIVKEHPLHPAYTYLSLVHRSDYLRCYFMHFHGGGYVDIKEVSKSWKKAFQKINESTKWGIGYPEIAPSMIPKHNGKFGKELRRNYFRIIGNAGFIFKPNSPFTEEWLSLVEEKLTLNFDKLKKNPGNTLGTNEGYPLSWAEIQGYIFHPLCFKYSEFIMQDDSLEMSFENYR